VRVQPRASRNEVAGVYGDALKLRLTAPPVEGAANEALVAVLAKAFAVAPRAVRIVAGHGSRSKLVEVDGIQGADVRRLAAVSASL
jgi:uncharacterized protein (TIGR00251 family)